jgi:hypothetical protein
MPGRRRPHPARATSSKLSEPSTVAVTMVVSSRRPKYFHRSRCRRSRQNQKARMTISAGNRPRARRAASGGGAPSKRMRTAAAFATAASPAWNTSASGSWQRPITWSTRSIAFTG